MDTAALRRSWAAVEQRGDDAAAYFYATLFTLDPNLRVLFPTAMNSQRDRFLAALGHVVSHLDDGPRLTAFLWQLGRDHRRFDVRAEHFPAVGQALLHTVARTLGEAWTPQLAADWAEAYDMVSRAMVEAAAQSAHEPARWRAEIISHERRCGDVAVIHVRVAEPYDYRAGQSLAVESHLRPRVWRFLSPANAPHPDGTLELHVRAVPGGQLSPALVYQSQVGAVLHLSAPLGHRLTVPAGSGPDLLLLAGGTGLAPFKAVIDQLTRDGDERRITLVVGAQHRHELYDLDALWGLANKNRHLTVIPTLSADRSLGEPMTVADVAVRHGPWHERRVLICGSPAMVSGTRQLLVQHGHSPASLQVEQYDGTTYPGLQEGERH